jgi:hypothetical protein
MMPPDFSKLSQYEMQRLETAANYKQVHGDNVDDECNGNSGRNYSKVLPGLRYRPDLSKATEGRSTHILTKENCVKKCHVKFFEQMQRSQQRLAEHQFRQQQAMQSEQ